jgi:Clostridial hydrophobic W
MNISFKRFTYVFTCVCMYSTLISCSKNEEVVLAPQVSDTFFIKNMNGDVVGDFDPSLLGSIHQDLIVRKRVDDADKLSKTYDIKTGKLLSPFVNEAKKSSKSSRVVSTALAFYSEAAVGNYNNWLPRSNGYCGTVGQSLPMMSIRVQTTSGLSLTGGYINISGINPQLTYATHLANVGWTSSVSQSNVSPTGPGPYANYNPIEAIVFQTGNPSCYVWYQAHVANKGWLGWVPNGQIAGTTGQSRNLEAVALQIFLY